MRDVAALAGVAHKTVSRVFSGTPTVDPALVERVRRAAESLGYRPNRAADLRSGQSDVVGLLVQDVGNPFFAAVLRAIESTMRTRGKLLLTASLDEDPEQEVALTYRLIDHRVDGLIIATSASDHRYLVGEQARGTALVFVDRVPEPLVADAVLTEHEAGARQAVEHLLATGRRTVAFLGDDHRIQTADERYRGYLQALGAAGLVAQAAHVRHDLRTADQAQAALSAMLSLAHPPEAVFAAQNLVTEGAVRALHVAGRQHQVALVGFDDIPFADLLDPGVTVVAQDTAGLGRLAAQRLLARLDGDDSPAAVHRVPVQLIARGSGERPA